MKNPQVKKWLRWSAISFFSGSVIGGFLPLFLASPLTHQMTNKVVTMIMAAKG